MNKLHYDNYWRGHNRLILMRLLRNRIVALCVHIRSTVVIHRKPSPIELPNITRVAYCVRCGHVQQRVNLPGRCKRTGCYGNLSRRHFGTFNRHARAVPTVGQGLKIAQRTSESQLTVTRYRAGLAVKSSVVPCVTRGSVGHDTGLLG